MLYLLFILAFTLRILFVPSGGVSFHYDMSRDAFAAREIWQKHQLKLLGPPSSAAGLYHGVAYYYLIALPYGLSGGDPRWVAIFLSLISSLTIFPLCGLAKRIFVNPFLGNVAAFLLAIAYEAIGYGSWLSNPGPALFTVTMFYYYLYRWIRGESSGLVPAVFWAVISFQFQLFLIYLFPLLFLAKLIFKPPLSLGQSAQAGLWTCLGSIPFIVAAIKFNLLSPALDRIVAIGTHHVFGFRAATYLFDYLNQFAHLYINNFFPNSIYFGIACAVICLLAASRHKFIIFLLLSNIFLFLFGGHNSNYANLGLIIPAILSVAAVLQLVGRLHITLSGFVVLIIGAFTLNAHFANGPQGQLLLVIPQDMNLANELALIDSSYAQAGGQPFSISTLTLPLWTNTTWAYLYHWYGLPKYGYVPSYFGHDQTGLPGAGTLPQAPSPLPISFYIMEPQDGIRPGLYAAEIDYENSKTTFVSETQFSNLTLQLRQPH